MSIPTHPCGRRIEPVQKGVSAESLSPKTAQPLRIPLALVSELLLEYENTQYAPTGSWQSRHLTFSLHSPKACQVTAHRDVRRATRRMACTPLPLDSRRPCAPSEQSAATTTICARLRFTTDMVLRPNPGLSYGEVAAGF